MLAAAGLATTWLYKKARVLAIFDDLDTVLLMIPLKMMLIGFEPKLLILVFAVFLFLAAAYFCIHWLPVPTSNVWIAIYALLIWGVTYAFDYVTDLHLEVLVPAFALGCVIKSDHLHGSAEYSDTKHVSECSRIARTGDFGLGASKADSCCSRAWRCRRFNWAAWPSSPSRARGSHHHRQQHWKMRAHDGVQRRSRPYANAWRSASACSRGARSASACCWFRWKSFASRTSSTRPPSNKACPSARSAWR